ENFEDEKNFDREYGILGAAGAWLYSPRRWHFLHMEDFERDVADHRTRELRFLRHVKELTRLRGIQVVSCSLPGAGGSPLGGSGPLGRWFDDLPARPFLWFQSVGNTEGQSWAGNFRDADGNGVMEFTPPAAKLPPGSWTDELNFLGW